MRRFLSAVGLIAVMSITALRGAYPVKGANPAAGAIQTQIAELEATLTAIASTPAATQIAASKEFDLVDSRYATDRFTFHIVVKTLAPIHGTLHDMSNVKVLTPRGRFVVLQFEITNMSTDPAPDVSGEDLILIRDDKGRAYSKDGDASDGLMFGMKIYVEAFQPGLPYDAVLVYDVAKDSANFTLEVKDTAIKIPLRETS